MNKIQAHGTSVVVQACALGPEPLQILPRPADKQQVQIFTPLQFLLMTAIYVK